MGIFMFFGGFGSALVGLTHMGVWNILVAGVLFGVGIYVMVLGLGKEVGDA